MYLNRYISLSLLFLLTTSSFGQISFNGSNWEKVLEKAKADDKIIFVDVYTKWCGPCKKMDKETFQSKDVGTYMNEKFINVKWDAESPESAKYARQYAVRGFPTLLFIASDGNVIKRQAGYQNSTRFLDLAGGVYALTSQDHASRVNQFLSANLPDHGAMTKYLKEVIGYKFPEKQNLYQALFEGLKTKEKISGEELDVVIDNIYTTEHIHFAIAQFPHRKQGNKERINRNNQKTQIKTQINNYFKQAIQLNDHALILDMAKANLDFENKINSQNVIGAKKENNDKLLEFYKKHFYKEDFFEQANIFVTEFVDPFPPEMIAFKDQEQQKRSGVGASGTSRYQTRNPRIRLKEENKFSYKISTQLNEVASSANRYFDDMDRLVIALSWTEKAEKYLDLPEVRLTRSEILRKIGMHDEALFHVNRALDSNLANDKLREKLNKIKASLIN